MADNLTLNLGSGGSTLSTDEVTRSAVVQHVQYVKLMNGTDAATDVIPGEATNGLDVDVTRLPALPAGTNNIGDVDVLTLPALPAGTNNIGDVDVLTLPALAAGTNNIGDVDVLTLPATSNAGATAKTSDYDTGAGTDTVTMFGIALPASGGSVQGGTATNPVRTDPTGTTTQPVSGTITANLAAGANNIGDVDVLTLPALPAGTNNIGDVDVLTLPSTTNAGATAKTSDYDTGAGTDTVTMFGMALPASGGSVQGGTATNPLRTDPTGTTTQPVSGTVTANLASGVNNIGDVDVLTLPALPAGTNNIGDVDVLTLPALPAGTNNIGDVDVLTLPAIPTGTNSIGTVQPGNTANTTPWLVTDTPSTVGGLTAGRIISAATTNATSVKGSAGQLYTILAHNINAAVRYLKLYNKATAPTVGTDTPILTMPIPGNTAGTGFVINCDKGWAFSLGVAAAITTGVADADTGAVAANEIVINFGYK